jgi:hypothetical protein
MVARSQGEDVTADKGFTDPDNLAHPNASCRTVRLEDPIRFGKALEMHLALRHNDLLAAHRDPLACPVNKAFKAPCVGGFKEELKGKLERDAGAPW